MEDCETLTMIDKEIREFYCIICPIGCRLSVKEKPDGGISVSGNECPRGVGYAESEVRNPERILTTTVRSESGESLIPVRSDKPVPLKLLRECVIKANGVRASIPVHVGDVIVRNVRETGADIVASADLQSEE